MRIASVAVCTMLATAAGCLSSILYMWAVFGKPDPTMGCNGLLAGAVAITAPCAFVNPVGAVIIGAIAGVLVIWSVLFVERVLKVDDPVGAVSVHGVCGAFGCLSIGLFATGEYGAGWNGVANLAPTGLFYGGGLGQLAAESIGVLANVCWVVPTAFLSFMIIEKTIGNRTSARVEIYGLDIPEMGVQGYVNEDSVAVQVAGQEHLSTYGPGVPAKIDGRRQGRPRRPFLSRSVRPDDPDRPAVPRRRSARSGHPPRRPRPESGGAAFSRPRPGDRRARRGPGPDCTVDKPACPVLDRTARSARRLPSRTNGGRIGLPERNSQGVDSSDLRPRDRKPPGPGPAPGGGGGRLGITFAFSPRVRQS